MRRMRRVLVWCLLALLPWRLWAADAMAWRMAVTPALALVAHGSPTGPGHPAHPHAAHDATGACAHGSVASHGSHRAHHAFVIDGGTAASPPAHPASHTAAHPAPTDDGGGPAATPLSAEAHADAPCRDAMPGGVTGHATCTVCDLCHNPPLQTTTWALPPHPVPHAWRLTQWRAPADPAPRPLLKPPIA